LRNPFWDSFSYQSAKHFVRELRGASIYSFTVQLEGGTMATDPEQERHDLMDVYSRMADGEIQKIAQDAASLTDVARLVLHDEMAAEDLTT